MHKPVYVLALLTSFGAVQWALAASPSEQSALSELNVINAKGKINAEAMINARGMPLLQASDEAIHRARNDILAGITHPANQPLPEQSSPGFQGTDQRISLSLGLGAPPNGGTAVANPHIGAPQEYGTALLPFSTARADLSPIATNQQYPYRAVGKLFMTVPPGSSSSCTASLIRPGVVVTAAHCVEPFSGHGKFFTSFVFVPGYRSAVPGQPEEPYGEWGVWLVPAKKIQGSYQSGSTSVATRDTTGVVVGQYVQGPGIVLGTTVTAVSNCDGCLSGFTLSQSATADGANAILTLSSLYIRVAGPWDDGTDACVQKDPVAVCPNDVAVLVLAAQQRNGYYYYPGHDTGWLGYGWSSFFTPGNLVHVTQLGYPGNIDNANYMQRNDAEGAVSNSNANNTLIGTLMGGGSSGGPFVANFGIPGNAVVHGSGATPNTIVGVMSFGSQDPAVLWGGASPFTQANIGSLVDQACTDNRRACSVIDITYADYGEGNNFWDRTDLFQMLCGQGPKCDIPINNSSMGGDPSPNRRKVANYHFVCYGRGPEAHMYTQENETAHLSCQ